MLLQWLALILVAKVAETGIEKYGVRNWEEHADEWKWSQLWESASRHMAAWALREDDNPEGGLPHLAHAAWNILSLIELTERGLGTDDRSALPKVDLSKYLA